MKADDREIKESHAASAGAIRMDYNFRKIRFCFKNITDTEIYRIKTMNYRFKRINLCIL